MAKIKVNITGKAVTGKVVTFTAVCDCASVTDGLIINGETYAVCDAMGNCVTGKGGAWCAGAQISVVLDCENKKAYIQNAAVPEMTIANVTGLQSALNSKANAADHQVSFYTALSQIGLDDATMDADDFNANCASILSALPGHGELRVFLNSTSGNLHKSLKAKINTDTNIGLTSNLIIATFRRLTAEQLAITASIQSANIYGNELGCVYRNSIKTTSPMTLTMSPNGFSEANHTHTMEDITDMGAWELLAEYTTAGAYTADIPDNCLVFAIAVSGGQGGGGGGYSTYGAGGIHAGNGGKGGDAVFVGPVLSEKLTNKNIVVGAGGAGGTGKSVYLTNTNTTYEQGGSGELGGSSSVFGITTDCEYNHADGGGGGTAGSGNSKPTAGSVASWVAPISGQKLSAGGGGGCDNTTHAVGSGGVCDLGSGGKGGKAVTDGTGANGTAGAQCCGGGGGGNGTGSSGAVNITLTGGNGGKGGDGYVAIWIKRGG